MSTEPQATKSTPSQKRSQDVALGKETSKERPQTRKKRSKSAEGVLSKPPASFDKNRAAKRSKISQGVIHAAFLSVYLFTR